MPSRTYQYQLVYSFYTHALFGILIEPYVVQRLENGHLSLTYQKIGSANITDFYPEVSNHDKKLLQILDKLSNLQIAKILSIHPNQLEIQLAKISKATDLKSKSLFELVKQKLSQTKAMFVSSLTGGELLFEMTKDGNPAGVPIVFDENCKVSLAYVFTEDSFSIQPKFSITSWNKLMTLNF